MPPGRSLEIQESRTDSHALVVATGEIGFEDAAVFRAAVRRAVESMKPKTIVDLGGVEFMNTPGLAVLVEAMQAVRRNKLRLLLCRVGPRVLAVLEIAKLNRVFEIFATREDAEKA